MKILTENCESKTNNERFIWNVIYYRWKIHNVFSFLEIFKYLKNTNMIFNDKC